MKTITYDENTHKLMPLVLTQEMSDAGRAALTGSSTSMMKLYRVLVDAAPATKSEGVTAPIRFDEHGFASCPLPTCADSIVGTGRTAGGYATLGCARCGLTMLGDDADKAKEKWNRLPRTGAPPTAAPHAQAGSGLPLEELITLHRISITPEYEGGFFAAVYGDEAEPQAERFGGTPREAIVAAMEALPKNGGAA